MSEGCEFTFYTINRKENAIKCKFVEGGMKSANAIVGKATARGSAELNGKMRRIDTEKRSGSRLKKYTHCGRKDEERER